VLLSYTTLYLIGGGVVVAGIALAANGKRVGQTKPKLWARLSAAVFVLGVVGFIGVVFGTKQVYIFHGSADHPGTKIEHDKYVLLGSTTIALEQGKSITIPLPEKTNDDAWIVNDTDRALTVEVAQYSQFSFGGSGERRFNIEVGGADSVHSVDLFGPTEHLPASVESEGTSATRTWVTW
jgi:hypothetical protein